MPQSSVRYNTAAGVRDTWPDSAGLSLKPVVSSVVTQPIRPIIFLTTMTEEVTYELATARWRRTSTVQIVSVLDTDIADFPLSFLASSGDVTWQYILHVIRLLILVTPELPGCLYIANDTSEEEIPVDVSLPPAAGRFRYKQLGKCLCPGWRTSMFSYCTDEE